MKKFPIILTLCVVMACVVSCGTDDDDSDTWGDYKEWREDNEAWLEEQAALTNPDGTPYYERITPSWNPSAYVLMHWFNDRSLTAENLKPYSTSTVDVKYYGRLYDDVAFDSSYAQTAYGDSIYRTQLTQVITGWMIAVTQMHVGDSVDVLIPYQQGYNSSSTSVIKPYSALRFGIKLVDIPYLEIQGE